MPHAAILGYYDRANFGDDLFKVVIPQLLPRFKLDFINVSDDAVLTEREVKRGIRYEALLLGAGDVLLDYFVDRFRALTEGISREVPRYVIGGGAPYLSYLEREELNIFDHFFIRTKSALIPLSRRFGGRYCHYLPDLVFSLPFIEREKYPQSKKKIGIFPIGPKILGDKKWCRQIYQEITLLMKSYEVILYPFDTSSTDINSDLPFCELMRHKLGTKTVIKTCVEGMRQEVASLDAAICMRFHAHILCLIEEIPFVSYSDTPKVNDLLYELTGKKYVPYSFEGKIFEEAINSREYRQKVENYRFSFNSSQMDTLLYRRDLRKPCTKEICRSLIVSNLRGRILDASGKDISRDRKYSLPEDLSREIAQEICFQCTKVCGSSYEYGTYDNVREKSWEIPGMIEWILDDVRKRTPPSIDMNYIFQNSLQGFHRAGWQYVVNHLRMFDASPHESNFGQILCDTFADRTFLWGCDQMKRMGYLPYTGPWIGFFHHTGNQEYSQNNLEEVIKNPLFKQSLSTCRGIIVLSEYLQEWFKKRLWIPIYQLYHPTLLIRPIFSLTTSEGYSGGDSKETTKEVLRSDPEIVQIGAWYRNPWTIHLLDLPKKYALKGKDMNNYFMPPSFRIRKEDLKKDHPNRWVYYFYKWLSQESSLSHIVQGAENFWINTDNFSFHPETKEMEQFTKKIKDYILSVQRLECLSNDQYDDLLTKRIVFLHLIDASAANTVIECLASSTPLIINRHPAVIEYLGKDYPFFYDHPQQVDSEFVSPKRVEEAFTYLQKRDKRFIHIDTFLEKFEKIIKKSLE